MIAPYSLNARSNDVAERHSLGIPVDEGKRDVELLLEAKGDGELPTRVSSLIGRAPRRASQDEKYAVPHPSSTTSRS
jgi:hypothetical protein